jgi:hypothetical protein
MSSSSRNRQSGIVARRVRGTDAQHGECREDIGDGEQQIQVCRCPAPIEERSGYCRREIPLHTDPDKIPPQSNQMRAADFVKAVPASTFYAGTNPPTGSGNEGCAQPWPGLAALVAPYCYFISLGIS